MQLLKNYTDNSDVVGDGFKHEHFLVLEKLRDGIINRQIKFILFLVLIVITNSFIYLYVIHFYHKHRTHVEVTSITHRILRSRTFWFMLLTTITSVALAIRWYLIYNHKIHHQKIDLLKKNHENQEGIKEQLTILSKIQEHRLPSNLASSFKWKYRSTAALIGLILLIPVSGCNLFTVCSNLIIEKFTLAISVPALISVLTTLFYMNEYAKDFYEGSLFVMHALPILYGANLVVIILIGSALFQKVVISYDILLESISTNIEAIKSNLTVDSLTGQISQAISSKFTFKPITRITGYFKSLFTRTQTPAQVQDNPPPVPPAPPPVQPPAAPGDDGAAPDLGEFLVVNNVQSNNLEASCSSILLAKLNIAPILNNLKQSLSFRRFKISKD